LLFLDGKLEDKRFCPRIIAGIPPLHSALNFFMNGVSIR
jgi:hypothetical protein